jgi:putative spermidine/putrescine transport system ATP-binding protein
MTDVQFKNITKHYGTEVALCNFSLNINSGELVSILGPSGCGKTTALRILAGFIQPTEGNLVVGGQEILDLPAAKRGYGMVFQSYSLFPNMTTFENIEFPLKLRKIDAAARAKRVNELLDLINMAEHARKFPHQLSGGQQQRVALARAVALEPPILLLDEPLSALDATVRDQLRDEIRSLQKRLGITTVFVTHDQQEAMAISDRVAVMRSGQVEQLGSPRELYQNPKNSFVAGFVGISNQIKSTKIGDAWKVLGSSVSGPTEFNTGIAFIRPEDVKITPSTNGIAVIEEISFLGSFVRVFMSVDGARVIADLQISEAENLTTGQNVELTIRDANPLIESMGNK